MLKTNSPYLATCCQTKLTIVVGYSNFPTLSRLFSSALSLSHAMFSVLNEGQQTYHSGFLIVPNNRRNKTKKTAKRGANKNNAQELAGKNQMFSFCRRDCGDFDLTSSWPVVDAVAMKGLIL